MSNSTRRISFDQVLLDMNTQCDFLLPKGSLPVANRAEILPNIRKIMNWGRVQAIPMISSLECHRPGETTNGFPPHCVDRSCGQKKLPFTLMPRRIVLQGDNTLDLPHEPFRRYQQVIFTKRNRDFLSNPKADRLINTVRTRCFVVFGVLTERCIKQVVLGLLARQRQIVVVRDACGCWCGSEAELAFRQMAAKGAILVTTEELVTNEVDAKLAVGRSAAKSEEARDAIGSDRGNGGGRRRTTIELRVPERRNGKRKTRPGDNGRSQQDIADLVKMARRKLRSAARRKAKPRQDHA